jgi:hypothetical protein
MSTHRYAIPVETTGWVVPNRSEATFDWEYDEGRQRLLGLYDKGKQKQWDAAERIDWSIEIDHTDQDAMPDAYVPIFGSETWEKLSRAEKDDVRHHYGAWLNSQFLHGEQGALICSAKIVETVPELDAKFYAATQTMDEARHVEAYARYLNDKLQLAYPINPHLKALLDQTISDDRWDFTYLGMQVMIEGVALAAFSMIRDFTEEPLAKSLNAYVMQDEARHVAFGRLALKDAYAELTEAERDERMEFVIEASELLRNRFLAEEVWDTLGFDSAELIGYVDQHQMMGEFRKALFSRVVPCVKDIGLLGPKVQKAFAAMGVLDFQDLELDELFEHDDRVAMEMEAMLAARKEGIPFGGMTGRGAEIAETVLVGAEAEDEQA